jgi:hypothetical protein
MADTRPKFDEDFKIGAVRIVRESGKPTAQVARDPVTMPGDRGHGSRGSVGGGGPVRGRRRGAHRRPCSTFACTSQRRASGPVRVLVPRQATFARFERREARRSTLDCDLPRFTWALVSQPQLPELAATVHDLKAVAEAECSPKSASGCSGRP